MSLHLKMEEGGWVTPGVSPLFFEVPYSRWFLVGGSLRCGAAAVTSKQVESRRGVGCSSFLLWDC